MRIIGDLYKEEEEKKEKSLNIYIGLDGGILLGVRGIDKGRR